MNYLDIKLELNIDMEPCEGLLPLFLLLILPLSLRLLPDMDQAFDLGSLETIS